MRGWIIDSSLALSWALPDEDSGAAERFLESVPSTDKLWVPALWWYEISNGLAVAERRRRITEAEGQRAVEIFRRLPLETDLSSGPETLWRLRSLAKEHELSAYDAAYLDLAERRDLALASLDSSLNRAARTAGIEVFKP